MYIFLFKIENPMMQKSWRDLAVPIIFVPLNNKLRGPLKLSKDKNVFLTIQHLQNKLLLIVLSIVFTCI